MLSAHEIFDIIVLAFFAPALAASGYVVYKHGHRKQLGWRFLVMICLFRLVGAACALAAIHSPSTGLIVTYDVMASFGLSAVVYCALGLLDRVNVGMEGWGLPRRFFQLLHLPGMAGLILSIIGCTNLFSSNPSDVSEGFKEIRAAICLFSVVFVADVLVTGRTYFNISHVLSSDRRLLHAVTAALPFILVRTLYSLLCVFATGEYFSTWSLEYHAILVHGCMGVLMEAIIVSIFIWAGVTTATMSNPAVSAGRRSARQYDMEGK